MAEIVLTRPTAPHVAETVEVLARLGVARGRACGASPRPTRRAPQFVTLSPRLALLEQSLERAAAVALRSPRAPGAARSAAVRGAAAAAAVGGAGAASAGSLPTAAALTRGEAAPGCPTLPGGAVLRRRAARLRRALRVGGVRQPRRRPRPASPRASRHSAPARRRRRWSSPGRAAARALRGLRRRRPPAAAPRRPNRRAWSAPAWWRRRAIGRRCCAWWAPICWPIREASKLIYDAVRLFPARRGRRRGERRRRVDAISTCAA